MILEHHYKKDKRHPRKQDGTEVFNKRRWNELYLSGAEKGWGVVDEHVPEIVQLLKHRGADTVLDLGCGSGRHLLYLARNGFQVYGIDLSSKGIQKAKKLLKRYGFSAKIKIGSIYRPLPYIDSFFDAVISTHAFHHARIKEIRSAIKEVRRVLKSGGILFITVRKRTSKKHRHPFKVIAPHTYVPIEGREKGIIHYLFTKALLRKEFKKFIIRRLWIDKYNYYCLLGELRKKDCIKQRRKR